MLRKLLADTNAIFEEKTKSQVNKVEETAKAEELFNYKKNLEIRQTARE